MITNKTLPKLLLAVFSLFALLGQSLPSFAVQVQNRRTVFLVKKDLTEASRAYLEEVKNYLENDREEPIRVAMEELKKRLEILDKYSERYYNNLSKILLYKFKFNSYSKKIRNAFHDVQSLTSTIEDSSRKLLAKNVIRNHKNKLEEAMTAWRKGYSNYQYKKSIF